jgi:nucleotide-binding universal stress UspA family protein
LRIARSPDFAVPQTYTALPTLAVIGIDFSDAATAAVRSALELLPTINRLVLVHVAPRWDHAPLTAAWFSEYERSVLPCLKRIIRELHVARDVEVTNVVREGKAARELVRVAEEYAADAIVVGSRGLGFVERVLVGSTASAIIRGAQVAAFALPLAAVAAETAGASAVETAASA